MRVSIASSHQLMSFILIWSGLFYDLTNSLPFKTCQLIQSAIVLTDQFSGQYKAIGTLCVFLSVSSKSQRATVKSHAATLSRVRVARQSRATKSQV